MILKWTGRVLIGAGVLVLLFVVYQLFGTNLIANQTQKELQAELEAEIQAVAPDPTPAAPSSPLPAAPPPDLGDGVAIIEAPDIGLRAGVVEGVSVRDLRLGPGHLPQSPLPGEPGNVVISGHRTTYGAPFGRLNELEEGDIIRLLTTRGTFEYAVTEQRIVAPTEVSVIAPTADSRLTLTTCHPKFSAKQRLIVTAMLVTPTPAAHPGPEEVPAA